MTVPGGDPGHVRSDLVDADGRRVVRLGRTTGHITFAHPELAPMLPLIGIAVERPTRRVPGRDAGEWRHYLELESAPAPWLKVVVRYDEQGDGRVVTAFLRRSLP